MHFSKIGIDLGGTNIRVAKLLNNTLTPIQSVKVPQTNEAEIVLDELYRLIDNIFDDTVESIGIGVPSVVDRTKGIVYNVQNIPAWKEIPLKRYLERRYKIPVFINNDANCFALGEKYFGKAKRYKSFVGLTIGTGLGAGIIIDNHLYSGPNCGAGEFGMVEYNDKPYEYYASGQYFKNTHGITGEDIHKRANVKDKEAVYIFKEYGQYLGKVIKMILYCYDIKNIIIGGSVTKSYAFFEDTMMQEINTFAYPKSIESINIQTSNLAHGGLLGAIALSYEKDLSN